MSNETYVYYDVYNYKNQLGTDGYTLPFCQFKFIPKVDGLELSGVLSNTKVLWVFGDGATSTSLTGIHAYTTPGEYRVNSYFYDDEGNPYFNTYIRTVVVRDYIEDAVTLRLSNVLSLSDVTLSAGRITAPISVNRTNSWQNYAPDKIYSIIPFASGGGLSTSYFEGASSLLYSHLEKYHSFYTRETSRSGTIEYVETAAFETPSTPLYCKLTNNNVIMTTASDDNAFFCGTSGFKTIYFKDDVASSPINLFFGFNSNVFSVNTPTVGLSCTVLPNTSYSEISVTSNGIDGEGDRDHTFDINSNKFINSKIAFVAKVKDPDWYTIKDINILSSYNTLRNATTDAIMDADVVIDDYSHGYIKGYVISRETADRAELCVELRVDSLNYNLTGFSSEFSVLDSDNTYKVAKQNEDFDMTASYKELGFQDLFNDKPVLFDSFLGSIVGNLSSSQDSIGKKVYEKIANFVDNNANIEKCNVAQLVSLLESIGDENILFEKSNFNFPAALKRLVDILSIKHSKLFGAANNFDLDFYNFGNSQEYQGKNLGSRIDTLTYTVSANTPIVALEKFSNTFRKLDTYRPLSAVSVQQILSSHPSELTYPLSAYSDDWSWGLIVNDGYVATDLPKYYNFFEYIPNSVAVYRDNVINFTDFNNTIPATLSSYSAWTESNGVIDTIIANQLYIGLDLL